MVFGLADATMSRDESWLFLILGRSLERVDMTSRIISTRVLAGDARAVLDAGAALDRRLRALPAHLPRRW